MEQIVAAAIVGLRLAVCISTYIDRNSIFAESPDRTASVTIRWRSEDEKEDIIDLIWTRPGVRLQSLFQIDTYEIELTF